MTKAYKTFDHPNQRPTVSVLLATYNGEKFLSPLLNSLLAQTRPPVEIVICDDVSRDGTRQLLAEFQTNSPIPVRLIFNKLNKGYQRNFFDGITACSGDYIAFCDQDDVWHSDKLEQLTAVISEHLTPSLVFSDCNIVDENLKDTGKCGFDYSGLTEKNKMMIREGEMLGLLLQRPCVTGMTMLCHRERLLQNIPADQTIPHDYLVSTGFAIGGDYHCVETPLVQYRQHSANVIGMQNIKKRKTRPRLVDPRYLESINRDLTDKQLMLHYLVCFKSRQTDKLQRHREIIKKTLDVVSYRLERRQGFRLLIRPAPDYLKSIQPNLMSFRVWMKDLRCFLRLKTHHFIRWATRQD